MAGEIMKAVQYSKYGGGPASLQHVTIPVPVPKKGEFLVKIEAASVNPADWKIQKGVLRPVLPGKFPYTPGHPQSLQAFDTASDRIQTGSDIAGEVVTVGADVTDFAAGDKVVSYLDLKTGGSLAEYAVTTAKTTAKLPAEVSAIDAACLPVAGLTALQSLTNSGVNIDGSYTGNVLITGAAGGVGLYAVQLAKLSGAHVTASVGERNIELLKVLGADEVLDYKTLEGEKLISPSGKKYDVIVNGAKVKWSVLQPQLSPTGIVQDLNPSLSGIFNSVVKKITAAKQKRSPFLMSANDKDLVFLIDLIAQGKIKTFVDSKFPLDKAEDAWAKSIDGHATGKVVVTITE